MITLDKRIPFEIARLYRVMYGQYSPHSPRNIDLFYQYIEYIDPKEFDLKFYRKYLIK